MNQDHEKSTARLNRRGFLKSTASNGFAFLGAGALVGSPRISLPDFGQESRAAMMSPNEDLMQEHALLNRALLIYEESIRRLEAQKDLSPDLLKKSAHIIQYFVEQYHEKLEEDYVFPRFEKAGLLLDLVPVLREQHKAGRTLTQSILSLSALSVFEDPVERKKLVGAISSFIRMYRPHASREGSVLFPAFRDLVPAREFQALGEMFEKREHELLGAEGFEGQVLAVAEIEKQLGIYELSRYTPT